MNQRLATFWREATTRRLATLGGALPLAPGFNQRLEDIGHMALIGPSRSGKTRYIEYLILQLMLSPARPTVVYFDPHGHSGPEVATHLILAGKAKDMVWIDFSDERHICGYNPLQCDRPERVPMQASQMASVLLASQGLRDTDSIEVMPKLRMGYGFLFHALMESGLTLAEGQYLVSEAHPWARQAIVRRLKNPLIKAYWERLEDAKPQERQRSLDVLLARLHPFWTNPLLNAITSQQATSLNVPTMLESGRCHLVVGQPFRSLSLEESKQMAALLFADIMRHIFSRPPYTGRPVVVIIDELADRLCGVEAARMFRGSLKYNLLGVVGTQSLSALYETQPELAHEAMTNALTKIVFRDCSAADLEILAKELALESLDFKAVKDEIEQTKFWPVETTRTIYMTGESSGGFSASGWNTGMSAGQTMLPDISGMRLEPFITSEQISEARGDSSSRGDSYVSSSSEAVVPFYEMEPFKEVSSRQFVEVEEQYTRAMQLLKSLKARQMVVKQRGKTMRVMTTPFWGDVKMPTGWLEAKLTAILERAPYCATLEQVQAEANNRLKNLLHDQHRPEKLEHAHAVGHVDGAVHGVDHDVAAVDDAAGDDIAVERAAAATVAELEAAYDLADDQV